MSLRYRAQAALGGFLLLSVLAFLVVAGPPAQFDAVIAQLALVGVSGLLMLLTGFANPLRERVGALRLTGVADVFLGVSLPLGELDNALNGDYGFFLVLLLGGLFLVLIGVDYIRGGEWFQAPAAS